MPLACRLSGLAFWEQAKGTVNSRPSGKGGGKYVTGTACEGQSRSLSGDRFVLIARIGSASGDLNYDPEVDPDASAD
ncbi:hypothetical protein [Botrimarina hoheduenensis]|uniref:Uncharacterized protein n=1 Tax=Botrimarina hoheduenensis TaxID=2528000 RepID=A0A5C5W9V6_9BACT|nr:hypothetical protein [Botrimarina hoheduenensis]TWT47658.1 hypothetical protein Pla111_12760 [Botrimarina hoheduenensis]